MEICLKNLTVDELDGIQGNILIKVELKGTDQCFELSKITKQEEAKNFHLENPQTSTFIFTLLLVDGNKKQPIESIELNYQNINGDHIILKNSQIHILFEEISSQNQEPITENDATELGQLGKLGAKTRETRNRELAEKYKVDYDQIHEQALIDANKKYQEVLAKYGAPLNQNQKEIEELQSKIDQNVNQTEEAPQGETGADNYSNKKVLDSDDE